MRKDPDSLSVLNLLGQHHEFMETIKNIAVMEDPDGDDAVWWSDYRSDDDQKNSRYKIKSFCKKNQMRGANKRPNINLIECNMSNTGEKSNSFEIIWANNCFQKSVDPFATLRHWWDILKEDGMLCLSVPQSNYIDDLYRWKIQGYSGEYFSWNMVNLIQILATCGFDCRDGHFKQKKHDPYIWAAVYKSSTKPMDPETTTWYHLNEAKLTPASIDECINRFGYVKQEFLLVEWLDHSIYDIGLESLP